MHVEDLIEVERQLGYRYEVDDEKLEHYQWVCPKCRCATVVLAQGSLWEQARGGSHLALTAEAHPPSPTFANPGLGQGPLSGQDADNFHP